MFGIDVATQRSAAMRQIGLVPQEMNFNFFEKPFDILCNYAGFYGVPRAEALVRAEAGAEDRRAVGQGAHDEPHAVGRHEAPADDRAGDDDAAAAC